MVRVNIQGCQKKIAAYLVSIGRLLCLAFLYGWSFLNKISLDWPLTLTTQPSTSKRSGMAHSNSVSDTLAELRVTPVRSRFRRCRRYL